MASRRPVTTAAPASRRGGRPGRVELVEKLLVGDSFDTSTLAYDFEADHVGFVGAGREGLAGTEQFIRLTGLPNLVVEAAGGLVWAWLGSREGFGQSEVEALASSARIISLDRGADARIALGEPAHGLGGWRLTHRQARAALEVAMRGTERTVRYGDVALLASILRDELLATALCRLYLEPLEAGRDRGEELRRTLRAYFVAGRSLTGAGEAIGVTRQAVARRLRTVEQRLGRPLSVCGADLELALRFEALDATRLSAL